MITHSSTPAEIVSDLFNCCVCYCAYDRLKHLPKVIPTCGHTVCSNCLSVIMYSSAYPACPLDRTPFYAEVRSVEFFTTNILVLQLLDDKLKKDYDYCDVHVRERNWVCMEDKQKVCDLCVESNVHKGHVIKHVNDVLGEAGEKKKRLEFCIKEFDSYQSKAYSLLEEEKKAVLSSVVEKFENLQQLLRRKEEELRSEIALSFALEKIDVKKNLEKMLSLEGTYKPRSLICHHQI